jgi:hypothetical protein
MQRFAPPIVGRDIEPRNRARLVQQLSALLFKSHPANKIRSPLIRWQVGV